MSHGYDTWAQYAKTLYKQYLGIQEDANSLKRISSLKYMSNIEDYITQTTNYNMKLGLRGLV
jgi:hypothetical protein